MKAKMQIVTASKQETPLVLAAALALFALSRPLEFRPYSHVPNVGKASLKPLEYTSGFL